MKIYHLVNNESLLIREAKPSDAPDMIAYAKKVGDESNFLSFTGEEFNKTVKEEEAIILKHQEAPNQIFLLGFIEDEMACMFNMMASHKSRLKHVGEFGISVTKKHWRKGIGRHALNYLLDWAINNPVLKKIELQVSVNNVNAIKLYKSLGFKEEGRKIKDFYLNGSYHDTFLMGLWLENE